MKLKVKKKNTVTKDILEGLAMEEPEEASITAKAKGTAASDEHKLFAPVDDMLLAPEDNKLFAEKDGLYTPKVPKADTQPVAPEIKPDTTETSVLPLLKHATVLGQQVQGSSNGAIYHLVGVSHKELGGALKIAVKRTTPSELTMRFEKEKGGKIDKSLLLYLQTESKGSVDKYYASFHVSIPLAAPFGKARAYASIMGLIDVMFTAELEQLPVKAVAPLLDHAG